MASTLTKGVLADTSVIFNKSDITSMTTQSERGGATLLNIGPLASVLGIQCGTDQSGLWIVDSKGNRWTGRDGDLSLVSTRGSLPLDAPVIVQGPAIFLPLATLATLSGMRLTIDAAAKRAVLERDAPPDAAAAQSGDSLETFDIPKTAAEIVMDTRRLSDTNQPTGTPKTEPAVLPPSHNSMRLGIGFGYAQGTDGAVTFSGSGMTGSSHLDFNMFTTQGAVGMRYGGGQAVLRNDSQNSKIEIGSLMSDLWGSGTGVRFGTSKGGRWSNLSLYVPAANSSYHSTVLAYSSEFRFSRQFSIGGEVATNGSMFLKNRFISGPLQVYGYKRIMRDASRQGQGVSASYAFARGINLSGAISRSGSGANRSDWQSVALQLPITRTIALTLNRSLSTQQTGKTGMSGLALSMPLNRMQVSMGYQFGSTTTTGLAYSATSRQRALNLALGYPVNPNARFDYQVSTRWQDDGSAIQTGQLLSAFRLAKSTDLQIVSGFPNFSDDTMMRFRLVQNVSSSRNFALEYGRLQPYQSGDDAPADRGVTLMFNQSWTAKTPASGGKVRGQALDLVGNPVRSVRVCLGQYHQLADAAGKFEFKNVPPGTYDLYIDQSSLAANFQNAGDRLPIQVTDRSDVRHEFRVVPLGSVNGRVFEDRNGNGHYDEGEGVKNVVLHLGGGAALSGADGKYSFYNIAPASYSVVLDQGRLLTGLTTSSSPVVPFTLKPDQAVDSIDFVVSHHDKDIEFQALP